MPRIRAGTIAEHREQVWAAIEESLASLLGEKSFDRVSLREIAERAGIARNTIYNYAPDKDALLGRLVGRASAELSTRVRAAAQNPDASAEERLRDIVLLLLTTFSAESHRVFTMHARSSDAVDTGPDSAVAPLLALHDDIVRVVADGVAEGVFAPTRAPDVDVRLLTGLMERAVREILLEPAQAALITDRALHLVRAAVAVR